MIKFNSDKKLRIMQITDIQEVPKVSADTIKLISAAAAKLKPDLIILTGDQIKGYGISYKGKGRELESHVADTINKIMAPIVNLGIPFAVTFGNHDRQVGVSNEEQFNNIYKKLSGFVQGEAENAYNAGTFNIPVYSSDQTKTLLNLYLIDSGTDKKGGGYEAVTKKQIDWYKSTRERLLKSNGKYIPSLVFQHIPLHEHYRVLKQVDKHTKGAVRAYRTHKNEYYIPGDTCAKGDLLLEPPSIPDENTGEFDALKEKGDIMGIFVGHDHKNNYVGKLDGIDIGFTPSCGFSEYGNGIYRGVRIFDFNEDDIKNYSTKVVTFKELCSSKLSRPVRDFIYRHAPATMDAAIPLIIKAVAAIILTGALITALIMFL